MTRDEAIEFYRRVLARAHTLPAGSGRITIIFERDGTHLFSEAHPEGEPIDEAERVERVIGGGRVEVRRFSADRASALSCVLPALLSPSLTVHARGRPGAANVLVHGPALADGRYLRLVLRRGPRIAFTVVSAYPVTRATWLAARSERPSPWPP